MNAPSALDCGSGCRGFDTRHSPQITAETLGAVSPLAPPRVPGSTGYSPNTVQRPDLADDEAATSEPLADAVRVPLGHGLFALVDAADAPRVLVKTWHAWRKPGRPDVVYAQHTFRHKSVNGVRGKTSAIWLHRFILEAAPGQLVDHRLGNGLDCRRENIRIATPLENSRNVTLSKNQRRGGFKGVAKIGASWRASIRIGALQPSGKRAQVHLGLFGSPEEAAAAYDGAARAHFGEFAACNLDVSPAPKRAKAVSK